MRGAPISEGCAEVGIFTLPTEASPPGAVATDAIHPLHGVLTSTEAVQLCGAMATEAVHPLRGALTSTEAVNPFRGGLTAEAIHPLRGALTSTEAVNPRRLLYCARASSPATETLATLQQLPNDPCAAFLQDSLSSFVAENAYEDEGKD